MTQQRLLKISALSVVFLGLAVVGCSDASMAGKSTTKPAAAAADNASVSDGSVPLNAAGTEAGAAGGPASPSTDSAATGAAVAASLPLIITKAITGLSALEDRPVTLSIATIDASGHAGPTQQITFNAGQSGSLKLPNICSGPATKIAVSVNAAASGGLGGLLGGGSGSISTAAGATGSSITFDPATCIVTQMLQGNKGDSLNFACADNSPVTVVGK